MVVTVMLARGLAPDAYGQFVFMQWVIELSGLICSLGVGGSMSRFLPSLPAGGPRLRAPLMRFFLLHGTLSLALSAAAFAVYLAVAQKPGAAAFAVLIGWSVLALLSTFMTAALQGLFRYDAVTVGNTVFVGAAFLAVWRLPSSIENAAIAMALAYAVGTLASLSVCALRRGARRTVAPPAPPNIRSVMTYGLNTWITGLLATLVWSRGEFAVLKWHLHSRDIAIYSAALSLNGAVATGAGLLTGALTPHLAGHAGAGDRDRIRTILEGVTQAVMMCTAAVAIGLIATGGSIVPLLLGPKYRESYDVLSILAISGVSVSLGCAYTILQIELHGRFGRNLNLVSLVLLLTISAGLTSVIGVLGGAIARLTAQLAASGLILWRLRHIDFLNRSAGRIGGALISGTLLVAGFYGFMKAAAPGPVTAILAGAAVLAVCVLMIRLIIGQRLLAIAKL